MESPKESEHIFDDHSDESEGDCGDELTVALPIEVSQIHADFTGPPRNGHEYLLQVQHERRCFPKVAVAPRSSFQNKTKAVPMIKPDNQTSETFIRSSVIIPDDVQKSVIETFIDVRRRVELRAIEVSEYWESKDICLPKAFVPNDLFNMCLEEPRIGELVHYDQSDVHKLLKKIVSLMNFTKDFYGLWLYAFLALLKEPIERDIYSTLRDISRFCSQVRKSEHPPSDQWISSSLIILLIGKHFGQRDLLD